MPGTVGHGMSLTQASAMGTGNGILTPAIIPYNKLVIFGKAFSIIDHDS